jgi:hypothetical protein
MYIDVPLPYPPAVRVRIWRAQCSIALFAQDKALLRAILCNTLRYISGYFLQMNITSQ